MLTDDEIPTLAEFTFGVAYHLVKDSNLGEHDALMIKFARAVEQATAKRCAEIALSTAREEGRATATMFNIRAAYNLK